MQPFLFTVTHRGPFPGKLPLSLRASSALVLLVQLAAICVSESHCAHPCAWLQVMHCRALVPL
eukprot:1187181-Alexandrium_andersonii.AAC.1